MASESDHVGLGTHLKKIPVCLHCQGTIFPSECVQLFSWLLFSRFLTHSPMTRHLLELYFLTLSPSLSLSHAS